jgi:Spy/CpxP family protein refolding chaperone
MKTFRQLLSISFAAALLSTMPALCADKPPAVVVAVTTPATTTNTPASTPAPDTTATPHQRHRILERWIKELGLTEDQQTQIEPLLNDEAAAIKPILAYKALTSAERKAMVVQIKLAARRQIRPLLSPEQQTLLDKESAQLSGKGEK